MLLMFEMSSGQYIFVIHFPACCPLCWVLSNMFPNYFYPILIIMNKQKETGLNFNSVLVLSTRHDVDHDDNEEVKT